jgi:hypothetical protein
MRTVDLTAPVGMTSRPYDISSPGGIRQEQAPTPPIDHTPASDERMAQAIAQARHQSEREVADDEALAAAAWLRRQGQKALVKLVVRLNRIEKQLGIED